MKFYKRHGTPRWFAAVMAVPVEAAVGVMVQTAVVRVVRFVVWIIVYCHTFSLTVF